LACILVAGAASGCSGDARLTLIPLHSSALTPSTQLEYTISPQECYWWLDDEGGLCLAMCYHNLSILGDVTRDAFEFSFVFKAPPPPENDELYAARRDVARGLWHAPHLLDGTILDSDRLATQESCAGPRTFHSRPQP
jgi:hypothetical protein